MQNKQVLAIVLALLVIICGVTAVAVTKNSEADNPERIGIICAMDSEAKDFLKDMKIERTETINSMKFNIGTLADHNVVVVQCGMGKVNAGVCAQTLIHKFNVKTVINSGVAGSLDPNLKIGDFVVSKDVVQHDFDVSPIGFKKGEIPYTQKIAFDADTVLVQKAYDAMTSVVIEGNKVVTGRVCTGDQFIDTVEQKEKITSQFGGSCCEMEGGAIAQVCYLNNTPFVIIRGISDNGDGKSFDEYQEIIAASVAAAVIKVVATL